MRRVLAFFCLFILVSACDKPMSEPETLDPIYKELLVDYSNAQKDVLEAEKKVEEAQLALEKVVPQTGQRRQAYGQYFEMKKRLDKAKQTEEFLQFRSKSRKYEARQAYIRAFEAKKSWPDPAEYSNYIAQKELKARSRNWRDRTPAYDAIKAYQEKKAAKESGSKSSGH